MNRIRIHDIYKTPEAFENQALCICGWVKTVRDMKRFAFMELTDGSCFRSIQVVLSGDNLGNYEQIAALGAGASVRVVGTLKPTPGAKQPFEVSAASAEVLGASPSDYPLQKKRHSVEFLRTIAHLRPRTNLFQAVFRIRSVAAHGIHTFFQEKGFVYVNTPIITGSDAEGAGELFRVTTLDMNNPPHNEDGHVDFSKDFFGRETSLTVSGQLSGEAFALAFGDIYTFGPTFRAENSNTPRHAAEFWMLEPEMAFCDLDGDMAVAEEMLKTVVAYVLERCPDEIAFCGQFVETGLMVRLQALIEADFARVTYTEAVDILQKSGVSFDYQPLWGADLQTEHERYLAETHFGRPVFVTHYPKDIKAFYMKQADDGKTVLAMDLLLPGVGELIGGSQREDRADILNARMAALGLDPEAYAWYMDLRCFGSAPHAGFGLGFERLIMYLTGVSNIRDVLPFPRTAGNANY